MNSLEQLVQTYAMNKTELDSYKKICDQENAEIKARMTELDLDTVSAGEYIAKLTVQHRETIDEDMLLEILRVNGYADKVIRTKEYVDMDLLENELYHGNIDKETMLQMQKCKTVKNVQALTIKKKKEN